MKRQIDSRCRRSASLAIASLASALLATAAHPAEQLTPGQHRLIELLSYVQVARDRCGYPIDADVLELTLLRDGLTFRTGPEVQARQEAIASAEQAFTGMRASVECGYALERFGPEGSEFKGLLRRRPE